MSAQKHIEMVVDYMVCDCGDLAVYDVHGRLTRCKDCAWYRDDGRKGHICGNPKSIASFSEVQPTDYCNSGMSREDAKKDGVSKKLSERESFFRDKPIFGTEVKK